MHGGDVSDERVPLSREERFSDMRTEDMQQPLTRSAGLTGILLLGV